MAITAEARTQVSQLYSALFGRAPDEEGLQYWTALLGGGATQARVAEMMYGTAPARAYFPTGVSNEEIIASFYLNVLGRAADAQGLAFWKAKLDAPGATPGAVIVEMIGIVAGYAGTHPAGLESQALFNNRVTVGQHYAEAGGDVAGATGFLEGVTADAGTVIDAISQIDGVVTAEPVFSSATVNGATLVLTYADASPLDAAHRPIANLFDVWVDGVWRPSRAVAVDAADRTVTLTLPWSVTAGQQVMVAYYAPIEQDDAYAIQDASGNNAASLSPSVVLNITPDLTAPMFRSATVDGATLVMNYTESQALAATHKPATSAFAVTVEGVARTVSFVAVDGEANTVTLTLASAVQSDETVTVAYNAPTAANNANAIQDISGNNAATLAPTFVVNLAPDVTAPAFAGATVNGATLAMTYTDSNLLDSDRPPYPDPFSVTVDGVERPVSAVAVNMFAKTVVLTLETPVSSGQAVTVAYTVESGDGYYAIQDSYGNDAETLSATAVVNTTPDTPGPVFSHAIAYGYNVIMTYTAMAPLESARGPYPTRFSVVVDGVPRRVNSIEVDQDAKTVTLWLATAVVFGQAVTVAYTDSTGGDDIFAIQDADGIDAASLSAVEAVNQTPYSPPSENGGPLFVGATIAGNLLVMSYTDASPLAQSWSAPMTDMFRVKVDGAIRTVTGVAVNSLAMTVSLSLDGAVASGQTVTVAYTINHAFNHDEAIQDEQGNDAASLGSTEVDHASTLLVHNAGLYDASGCTALEVDFSSFAWGGNSYIFHSVAPGTPLTISSASNSDEWEYILADHSGLDDEATVVFRQPEDAYATLRVPGVEHLRIESWGDGTGHYGNLAYLYTPALQTLTLTGNRTIALEEWNRYDGDVRSIDASEHTGGVAYTSYFAQGALSILGSSGADELRTFSTVDIISSGGGDDVISSGKGSDILTGGEGADRFQFEGRGMDSLNPDRTVFPTITDFNQAEGDSILLDGFVIGHAIGGIAQIQFIPEATFDQRVDAACADYEIDPLDLYFLNWFHYGGDTYVLFDNARGEDGFQDGVDQLVKLTGLIDLNSDVTLTGGLLH